MKLFQGVDRLIQNALFPTAPLRAELPGGYAEILREIKQRIQQARLRTILAVNSAMLLLYWDIGRMILMRQEREGWGARVIDRLSADLREAYPDMQGLSPRNLKYMRAFAAAWPEYEIVQAADDLLRHCDDKPTIGLLLCRSKNKLIVEYALRDLKKPMGVAEWETKIVEQLPAELKGSLPTVKEIEAELGEVAMGMPPSRKRKGGKR